MAEEVEYITLWENHNSNVKVEYRLYYDAKGNVITYTTEDIEGEYIVIDNMTYIEARPDVVVVDGKIVKNNVGSVISKLAKDSSGTLCEYEDMSIISSDDIGQHWKLTIVSYTE
jgi:hypothetical protein